MEAHSSSSSDALVTTVSTLLTATHDPLRKDFLLLRAAAPPRGRYPTYARRFSDTL